MFKDDDFVIPQDVLFAFANTLFSYLYYHHNMHSNIFRTGRNFRDAIGIAALVVEKNTYRFNMDVLNQNDDVPHNYMLCQYICESYDDFQYHRKLYLVTAFIFDLVIRCYQINPYLNLNLGPNLWMQIFRDNFEGRFLINDGFRGIYNAGRYMMNYYEEHGPLDIYRRENFLPNSYLAVALRNGRITPNLPEVSTDILVETLRDLTLDNGDDLTATAAQANSELNPFYLGVKEMPIPIPEELEKTPEDDEQSSDETLQKRSHGLPAEQSEQESKEENAAEEKAKPFSDATGEKSTGENPLEGTSAKLEESKEVNPSRRTRSKRGHDPSTKDSDPEMDSPSFKAKMGRK